MFTDDLLLRVEKSLQAELLDCGVTVVPRGHTTDWRTVPGFVTASLDYTALIKREGHKPLACNAGETICIPADLFHKLDVETGQGGISCWSHTRFTFMGGIDISLFITPPFVIKGEAAEQIRLINTSLTHLSKPDLVTVAERQRLLYDLLSHIASVSEQRPFGPGRFDKLARLSPALEYISTHLEEHFSSEYLAEHCSLSRSRFDALFKETIGMAPRRHIQRLRLQRACHLLRTGTDRIDEIGMACGFRDQFHFSRIFKKYCGVSPTAYRANDNQQGM